eukprot:CCRYP_017639-RA/>CCRYP_017639-RA protein AED:0.26 eAED:0.26 QI:0/-1/0/1/-1/1/1/0/162
MISMNHSCRCTQLHWKPVIMYVIVIIWDALIEEIEVFIAKVSEGESVMCLGLLGESIDLVDDHVRHGTSSLVTLVDVSTSVKSNEVISPLAVSGGHGGNSSHGTSTHAVVVFLMSLNILTKLNLAMSIEVKFSVEDEFRWALSLRDATFEGEYVPPENLGIH